MPRRVKNSLIRWLLAAAAAASLLALLIYLRPALLGQALVVSDPVEKADLIYVLAGDFFGSRVLLGAELGARGYARQVVLSGGRYGDQYEGDMAADFAVEHGYPRALFCPVQLDALSTIDEAR